MPSAAERRERLLLRSSPPRSGRLILGLMSGTSADGIDVALVRVGAPGVGSADAPGKTAVLEDFVALPYPPTIRRAVLALAEGARVTSGDISQLNFRLGEMFADAAIRACKKVGVISSHSSSLAGSRIALIGSHGQTVYHQGAAVRFLGTRTSSTLQLGEPAVIAARTGVVTVGDFRPADIAAGGQGAPLVPFVDYLLFRDSARGRGAQRGRVALNIGGIANMTVIPAAARPEDVTAFDTGPGNMIIDALVQHFTHGKLKYDRHARMAQRGEVIPRLLQRLLDDPYLRRPPPKTAGREQFGRAYVDRILKWKARPRPRPEDLIRTATVFTALSIADAMHRWVLPKVHVRQLIVSGGGARNPLLMSQLETALGEIEIHNSIAFGVPADAKEGFAFALLANETMQGRPANLPSATGACRPAILGKICYPPPR